ncbi:MAG TPA: DUF4062 domain-containing protein [Chthoniobacterales bacterium]|nr:DUF4062 domain-containing protein [Chthoniobacterales bacterium]
MGPRPTIFVSAVSKELRSARQLVSNTLTFLGYEPIWQDIFGTETGDLRQMLRDKIDQSKGVVQLVGQCYGAEPTSPDPDFGRVSYTQYEALYARKKGTKVWYLFMDEDFPIDPHEPEPEEQRQLQAAYRGALKVDSHLFHPLKTREALEAGVLKLRDDLTELRKGARRWAWGIAALIGFVALLVIWLVFGQSKVSTKIDKSQQTLEKIADRFDALASNGGVIANAKTPEEHYHNARIHELSGNFSSARKEYAEYLSANLEALDPWLSYSAMLKMADGKAGALEAMRYFAKLTPRTVSYDTALAMLEDADARVKKLEALAQSHPEFGPLPWLISQEYSEGRRGEQTLADQRAEKEWLQKYRDAQAGGKFLRYFLDKKEAQKWIETADARWAKLSSLPENVLENPVTFMVQEARDGWDVILQLADSRAKEIFYRLDGQGDFKSTGFLQNKNPQTGTDMIDSRVHLKNLAPGEHAIEVKYLDRTEKSNGPYPFKFSTVTARLNVAKTALNADKPAWLLFLPGPPRRLCFTILLMYRPAIKEIRYSLGSDALDQTFQFKPTDKMMTIDDVASVDQCVVVPTETQFASVQVIYGDGTKSALRKYAPEEGK